MRKLLYSTLLGFICSVAVAQAPTSLIIPDLFSSNMVFQQESEAAIWGWTVADRTVTVNPSWGSTITAVSNENGKWMVKIPTIGAGGPHTLSVNDGDKTINYKNILLGEVWLCSGQSNMQMPLKGWGDGIINADAEVNAANYPEIRLFSVPPGESLKPQERLAGAWKKSWQVCSPSTVEKFAATAYFFGRKLYTSLNIPIGLINASAGNTSIETWMTITGIKEVKGFEDIESTLNRVTDIDNRSTPTVRHNVLINPIIPYTIKGIIWYQGENNVNKAGQYEPLFKRLIESWREDWGDNELPFYFAQIAPWKYSDNVNSAELRQAQLFTREIANTGIISTLDIGDKEDIHPRNKQGVGKRLALWALAKNYGQESLIHSGPLLKKVVPKGNKLNLVFNYGNGLKLSGLQANQNFEIAGFDNLWRNASPSVENDQLVLVSSLVKEPVQVRYGWKNYLVGNLFNGNDLPSPSFMSFQSLVLSKKYDVDNEGNVITLPIGQSINIDGFIDDMSSFEDAELKVIDEDGNEVKGELLDNYKLQVSLADGRDVQEYIFERKFVVAAIEDNESDQIIVFPNPVKSALSIKLKLKRSETIDIYNQAGERILRQKVAGKRNSIDVTTLKPGVYFGHCIKERRFFKFAKD